MSTDNIENNESNNNESVSIEELNAQLEAERNKNNDLAGQLDALRNKTDELLGETKKAKEKARAEAEAAKQAEIEKAKKSGDFEQLLKSSEEQRSELEKKFHELQSKVSQEKVNNTALKIASELADGSNAELLSEFISRRLKYTDDGVKVLDEQGNLTVSDVNALKQEFANSGKFKSLLRGNQASGGSAAGSGNGVSADKTMSRADFEKLDSHKQMSFIKDGGRLTND